MFLKEVNVFLSFLRDICYMIYYEADKSVEEIEIYSRLIDYNGMSTCLCYVMPGIGKRVIWIFIQAVSK